jgi:hypothetical protein
MSNEQTSSKTQTLSKNEITNSAVYPERSKPDFKCDLEGCPFDVVPGPDGRCLLWWEEENTWVVSFPSLDVATRFLTGEEYTCNTGWDRSSTPMDVKAVLKRIWRKTGKCPQFEFDETSNIFDFYVPLGLGLKALARVFYCRLDVQILDQKMIDTYCPLVAQCLAGGDWGLESDMIARMAPIVTELLLRQTRSLQRMTDEYCQTDLRATKVRRMKEKSLKGVVECYDLDIDIDEFNTLKCKATAVINALAASGWLR